MAYFNQSTQFQEPQDKDFTTGLPLELGTIVIPLVSLLGFLLPLNIFQIFLMLIYLVLGFAYVYKVKIPRLPKHWIFYLLALEALLCVAWLFLGKFGA